MTGGATGATITLRRGVFPIVTVLDGGDAPVVRARVVVRRTVVAGGAVVAEVETAGSGRARLPALDPAESLRLEVSGPDGPTAYAVHAVPEWKAADMTIVLEAEPAKPPK